MSIYSWDGFSLAKSNVPLYFEDVAFEISIFLSIGYPYDCFKIGLLQKCYLENNLTILLFKYVVVCTILILAHTMLASSNLISHLVFSWLPIIHLLALFHLPNSTLPNFPSFPPSESLSFLIPTPDWPSPSSSAPFQNDRNHNSNCNRNHNSNCNFCSSSFIQDYYSIGISSQLLGPSITFDSVATLTLPWPSNQALFVQCREVHATPSFSLPERWPGRRHL